MIRPGAAATLLPLRYLVPAAAAYLLAALALPWLAPELAGHYYHPRVLALTHTVTLGWITLTIIGASYQLLPVVLARPLWSARLARWVLPVYALGVIRVVGHFIIGGWRGFVWSAALVAIAAIAHVVNAAATLAHAPASFTARMMALALAAFAATTVLGGLIGLNKVWPILPGALFPTLHAHVQLALLGWVLPTVIGVAARVYPMFLLAPEPGAIGMRLQFAALAVGVPVLVAGLLVEGPAAIVLGSSLVAIAVLWHVAWVLRMTRARKRPRLDPALAMVVAGALFLVPATAVGLALATDLAGGPHVALAYGVLALGGWASLTIAGMMLKIVPFLVWYRVYGARVGRAAVPTLGELSLPAAERAALVLGVAGFAALAVGAALGDVVVLRIAAAGVAASALMFATALGRVMWHLRSARPTAVMPTSLEVAS